jgi:hypothetical protein
VALIDYLENMERFAVLAGKHGACVALLAGPHRDAISSSWGQNSLSTSPTSQQRATSVSRETLIIELAGNKLIPRGE